MRSRLAVLAVLGCLTGLPGCLGGGSSLTGPTTLGDQGHTVWQISDGLCGQGVFGGECDLNQHIAVGASPMVQIRQHNSAATLLDHATLMGGATSVTISGVSTTTDDHGTLIQAHVGSDVAGVADVIVLDASGHEIDRAHITFVAAATLLCGELRTAVTRDLNFPGLTSGPITVTMAAMTTSTATNLACRANDASGNALLTVNAIRWSIATGSVGTISVTSDDLFASSPAVGATARLVTAGTGSGTIHALLGTASTDIAVSFH